MDKGKLRELIGQLASLKEEVEERQRRLAMIQKEIQVMEQEGCLVSDSVSCGKKGKRPLRIVKIMGFPELQYKQRKELLKKRMEYLLKKEEEQLQVVTELEKEIDQISDSQMRRILTLRYIEEFSWVQIAHRMGKKVTADSCRKQSERFLKKD